MNEPDSGRNFAARHPLPLFFGLAILITWLLATPALFFGLPFKPFQTAGAFGPLIAAVIVSTAMGGGEWSAFFRRMTNPRFGLGWLLLAVFGNVILYLLMALLAGAPLFQSLAAKGGLILTLYLPALFSAYLVNAIGEETGWTGFALPHLQQRFSPMISAAILGVVWAVWHLPGYFVPSEMGPFNPVGFIFFVLTCILTRLIWTWVTNRAKGSGIIGILLHASSNAASIALIPALLPAPTPDQLALSGLILLGLQLALAVLIGIFSRGKLSYRGPQPGRIDPRMSPEEL